MRWLAALLAAVAVSAAETPGIFYSKSLPGSIPPYVEITVGKTGSAVFNDTPAGDDPIRFQLSESETAAIYGLAGKLDYFSRPLESGLKVANMGQKTFRFEDGSKKFEARFNYSQDPDAQLLLDWFERINETVGHRINLERSAKFDRLGVDRAMLLLQVSVERNRIVAGEMLLPVLDRIAGNGGYINRARERAADIAQIIRAGAAKPK